MAIYNKSVKHASKEVKYDLQCDLLFGKDWLSVTYISERISSLKIRLSSGKAPRTIAFLSSIGLRSCYHLFHHREQISCRLSIAYFPLCPSKNKTIICEPLLERINLATYNISECVEQVVTGGTCYKKGRWNFPFLYHDLQFAPLAYLLTRKDIFSLLYSSFSF